MGRRDANGEWRRLHNEKLHILYCSPSIGRVIKSRRLRWEGYVARMEEGRSPLKILTDTPNGKRLLGRPRRRWEDNIRKDLEKIGINMRNWVDSAQGRDYWRALVNAALNLRISSAMELSLIWYLFRQYIHRKYFPNSLINKTLCRRKKPELRFTSEQLTLLRVFALSFKRSDSFVRANYAGTCCSSTRVELLYFSFTLNVFICI